MTNADTEPGSRTRTEAPPRPAVVAYGMPYLAVLWIALLATLVTIDGAASGIVPAAFWTVIWFTVLYRAWRGGPVAIRAVATLTTVIPGLAVVAVVGIGVMLSDGGFDKALWTGLPTMTWVVMVGYVGAFVVGIGLHRRPVREWVQALHPPRSRAEAAARGVPVTIGDRLRQGAGAAASGASRPDVDKGGSTDGTGLADSPEDGADGIPRAARDEPVTLDLGAALHRHAKLRLVLFAAVLCFFPGIPLVVVTVGWLGGDGETIAVLTFACFAALLVLALIVSVIRFRRRLGPGSILTVDHGGLTWVSGAEVVEFSWNGLAGVGISYHMAQGRNGKVMHMPQLEIFEQVTSPPGRWPLLDTRRRREQPSRPNLPDERYRLMLPAGDDTHRRIEAAIAEHREGLWLGWYERRRSDTPWFLR